MWVQKQLDEERPRVRGPLVWRIKRAPITRCSAAGEQRHKTAQDLLDRYRKAVSTTCPLFPR